MTTPLGLRGLSVPRSNPLGTRAASTRQPYQRFPLTRVHAYACPIRNHARRGSRDHAQQEHDASRDHGGAPCREHLGSVWTQRAASTPRVDPTAQSTNLSPSPARRSGGRPVGRRTTTHSAGSSCVETRLAPMTAVISRLPRWTMLCQSPKEATGLRGTWRACAARTTWRRPSRTPSEGVNVDHPRVPGDIEALRASVSPRRGWTLIRIPI